MKFYESKTNPKILTLDIETAPMLGFFWALWDQNIGLNQIKEDWHLLSFSAHWLGSPDKEIMYDDQRNEKDITNDKRLLSNLWKLLNSADIILTQNGKKFDVRKINARMVGHGMKPYSSFKHIDVLQIARSKFGFSSNKLEWMTKLLNKKHRKSSHKLYPGFELWKACLEGDKRAFKEMEAYNNLDVLSLEELFSKLQPWATGLPNLNLYNNNVLDNVCHCGSKEYVKNGFFYSSVGKYQRFKCISCGSETRDKKNHLSKEKREFLKRN
jgi:DNA polymerase III epsilon subunit-like protein